MQSPVAFAQGGDGRRRVLSQASQSQKSSGLTRFVNSVGSPAGNSEESTVASRRRAR